MSKHAGHAPGTHGFQRLVPTRKIGDSGVVQDVHAKADELLRIASFLDIVAVEALSAQLKITRWRARGIKVLGTLSARVVQTCVVTLEPVSEVINSEFERRYLPDDLLGSEANESDVFVDPEGEDPPEPLTNEIDLGEILVEELSLNLNPYPRKEGIAFEAAPGAADEPKTNPFAALAKLKSKLEPKD